VESAVPGGNGAAVSVAAQIATATWTAVPGVPSMGGVSVAAQIATAVWTAVPGTPTLASGGQSVAAQIATATWSAVPGDLVVGGVTLAAQVATATWTAIPGGNDAAVSVAAQVATATWSGVPGGKTLGGVSVAAQIATATWTAVPGIPALTGDQSVQAQIATAVWSAVPGIMFQPLPETPPYGHGHDDRRAGGRPKAKPYRQHSRRPNEMAPRYVHYNADGTRFLSDRSILEIEPDELVIELQAIVDSVIAPMRIFDDTPVYDTQDEIILLLM
jgi:hypothetical protein